MTLNEAIEHCEDEVKKECAMGNHACANEHMQLRDWLKDYRRLLDVKTRCRNCVYNVFDYQKSSKILDNGGVAILNTGKLEHLCSWLSQPIDTITKCPLISPQSCLTKFTE